MNNNMEVICQIGLFEQAKILREEVFVKEQGFQDEFESRDASCKHVVFMEEELPVVVGRIYYEDDYAIIGRIAVAKAYRKSHLGKQMMEYLEKEIKKEGYHKIKLSAQVQAKIFYQKMGYHQKGEEYLDEHCPHVTMLKEI